MEQSLRGRLLSNQSSVNIGTIYKRYTGLNSECGPLANPNCQEFVEAQGCADKPLDFARFVETMTAMRFVC